MQHHLLARRTSAPKVFLAEAVAAGAPTQAGASGRYRRMTIRLPDDVRAELEAVAGSLRRPAWRVLIDALRAYVGSGQALSKEERRVVRAVLRLHESTVAREPLRTGRKG